MSITLMFGGLLVRGPSSHLTVSFVKMRSLLTKKKKGKGMRKGDYWVESISSHQLWFLHLSSFYHSAHASLPPLKTKVFQFSYLTTVLLLILLSYDSLPSLNPTLTALHKIFFPPISHFPFFSFLLLSSPTTSLFLFSLLLVVVFCSPSIPLSTFWCQFQLWSSKTLQPLHFSSLSYIYLLS